MPIRKHVYSNPFTGFSLVNPSEGSSREESLTTRIQASLALFRSLLRSRTCRSYIMGYWVWRRCVRVEIPFSVGSARSYVTKDTMRTMSSISKYHAAKNTRDCCERIALVLHDLINFRRNGRNVKEAFKIYHQVIF